MKSLRPAAVNTPEENAAPCQNHPEDFWGGSAAKAPAMPKDLVL